MDEYDIQIDSIAHDLPRLTDAWMRGLGIFKMHACVSGICLTMIHSNRYNIPRTPIVVEIIADKDLSSFQHQLIDKLQPMSIVGRRRILQRYAHYCRRLDAEG